MDDPRARDVRELLERHLSFANSHSPPEDVHALDVDGLLDPAVTFVSFRRGGELLGVGALKRLDGSHAELKCMHTAQAARGNGIGRAIVGHLPSRIMQPNVFSNSRRISTGSAEPPAAHVRSDETSASCSEIGERGSPR